MESILGARDHALAISEVAVTLHEAHRTGTPELVRFEAEPVCWRTFSIDASRRYLRPDAFVILAVGDWERLWFIELDRGTQPASTICRKTHAYTAYATTSRRRTPRRRTRHGRPTLRRRPGPHRTRPQPGQEVSVTTPPRPRTRQGRNRQRNRRAGRTGRRDAATRVRQVIDRAPALTADQLSQLRDLLAAPPHQSDYTNSD